MYSGTLSHSGLPREGRWYVHVRAANSVINQPIVPSLQLFEPSTRCPMRSTKGPVSLVGQLYFCLLRTRNQRHEPAPWLETDYLDVESPMFLLLIDASFGTSACPNGLRGLQ